MTRVPAGYPDRHAAPLADRDSLAALLGPTRATRREGRGVRHSLTTLGTAMIGTDLDG